MLLILLIIHFVYLFLFDFINEKSEKASVRFFFYWAFRIYIRTAIEKISVYL